MGTNRRVVRRMGSMMAIVPLVYSSIGDTRESVRSSLRRCITAAGSAVSGVTAPAMTLAPSATKKEKKSQIASAASADVATLRNRMENSMATPSQKAM
jgi:hypothetical protein